MDTPLERGQPEPPAGDRPHPESILRAPDGRVVALKVHRARWSGAFPENSLPAIAECYAARVARLEIDVCRLRDADFLVVHDLDLDAATKGVGRVDNRSRHAARALRLIHDGRVSSDRPPLLSEVVALIASEPAGTLLELDLKDVAPLPWPRVAELARIVAPVKDRVVFGGVADWNLRRLQRVDPTLAVGFNPAAYLDWAPEWHTPEAGAPPRGAYGYLDAHPLAGYRMSAVSDYLDDRLGGILRLVPGICEAHLRLATFERMLDDGVAAAELFHRHGIRLDVWTLDAGTAGWRTRLDRAVAAGVDIVTTNTARLLARAAAAAS